MTILTAIRVHEKLKRKTGISRSTVRHIVKQDLQLKTYKRIAGQMLNENYKLKRRKFTTIEQLKLAVIEEWRKGVSVIFPCKVI